MKPNHKVKFPDFAGYNYKDENLYYRLVFAENKDYRAGYNSGSIIVCTSLTMTELKLFIANRLNHNYPGIIKIEKWEKEQVEYLTVIGLQKLSWYVKKHYCIMMHIEEIKNEITRKEYNDFTEAFSAVKEYLHNNAYSSLSAIILRRLEETSIPILEKIRPKRTQRNESDSNKEFYGN